MNCLAKPWFFSGLNNFWKSKLVGDYVINILIYEIRYRVFIFILIGGVKRRIVFIKYYFLFIII